MDNNVGQSIEITDQGYVFRHFQCMHLILLVEYFFQAGVGKRIIQDARFYFGKVQDVGYQAEEQITVLVDYFDKLFFFFLIVCLGKDIRETDYGIEIGRAHV